MVAKLMRCGHASGGVAPRPSAIMALVALVAGGDVCSCAAEGDSSLTEPRGVGCTGVHAGGGWTSS